MPLPRQGSSNYKKGRVRLQGLELSIENPKGSERSGTGPDGVEWRQTMSDHYGYIRRTTGADGEQVDAYVGPVDDAPQVFVVDQVNQQDGSFDEHKVMIGYPDQESAVAAYRSNFDQGWKVGEVTAMPMAEFKSWLKSGDLAKPLARPKTMAQPAQLQQARDRRRIVNRDRDSVVQAAIRLGGLKTEWRQDTTGDARGNKNIPGVGALWSDRSGTSLDDMASLLDQHGYVPVGEMERDGGVSWLQEALRDELSGHRTHYAPDSAKQEEALLLAEIERYAEEIARLEDQREVEYARIEAEHGPDAADDARALDEWAREYSEQLEGVLDDHQERIDTYVDGSPVSEADAARRDDEIRRADDEENRRAREAAGPAFTLEQQTERSLTEQTAQQQAASEAEAQAQRQAEQRSQADQDRDHFTLTGSDRQSDVGAARGQGDIVSDPSKDQLYRMGDGAGGEDGRGTQGREIIVGSWARLDRSLIMLSVSIGL